MEIQEAWDDLLMIESTDSRVRQEAARVNLITACVPMKKKTVRQTCCQLPTYLTANHKDDLYSECDMAVDKIAVRLINKDLTLSAENSAGYLKTIMLWKCYDFVSDQRKCGLKSSEPFCHLKDDFPEFESFDPEMHERAYDEPGFAWVDNQDELDGAFKTPFERMIYDCIADGCEINYSAIASELGCDPKTVAKTINACLAHMSANEVDYALGA